MAPVDAGPLDHWFIRCDRRRELGNALWRLFSLHGYRAVDLPLLVPEESWARTGAGSSCRVLDGRGRVLLIRPDVTPWIAARVAAAPPSDPLRLWYFAETARTGPDGQLEAGWQAGAELFGIAPDTVDREAALMAARAARTVARTPVKLALSDARLLPEALKAAGAGTAWPAVRDALAAGDRVRARALLEGADAWATRAVADLVGRRLPPSCSESFLEAWPGEARNVWRHLVALAEVLSSAGEDVALEPALVLGRWYYSGPVFEVTGPLHPAPLASGGRYDALLATAGRDLTAAGFGVAAA